ncbi:MAG: RNA methyltransferase [Bacteriovoracales bacterium]|nr:RNA methyltransferase [Bacteriovoracales bacterium]
MKRVKIYLGLVHYPVRNKRAETITSSVTNLDIHDIARACQTYGVERYMIVTPVKAQHRLLGNILGHWREEKNEAYNPDRARALSIVSLSPSWEKALEEIEALEGTRPLVAVTGARFGDHDGGCGSLVEKLCIDNRPLFILFGTGYGLGQEVVDGADFRLAPLLGHGKGGYNHLSVRSAVSIYLDRLRSEG